MTFDMKRPARARLAGLAAAMAIVATGAQAETRISLGLADSHAFYPPLVAFGESLKAAGIDNTIFSLQVLGVAEASNGVRDGLVDAAMVLFPYFANEYSESNLTAELSMLATSGSPATLPGAAMAGATLEYVFLNCPECQEQFKAQNQVYVSGTSTTDYVLVCNKPIAKVADMAGARIRTGAGNYTRIAGFLGAASVSMKGNEVYDALGAGVVDCTMQPAASLLDFRYIEVAKSVLLGFPGGVFSGVGMTNFNRDTWKSYTTEQRAAVLKAGAQIAAAGFYNGISMDAASIQAAKDKGLEVFEADEELRAKMTEFVEGDLATISGELSSKFGLQNVDTKIATVRDLIEKWKGLTNDPAMTQEKLAELYWTEVFSKVDPATYGTD